jgi:hypothetical protein
MPHIKKFFYISGLIIFSVSAKAEGEYELLQSVSIPSEGITALDLGLSEDDFVTPELAKKVAIYESLLDIPDGADEGISIIIEPYIVNCLHFYAEPMAFYSVIITGGSDRPRTYEELIDRAKELCTDEDSVIVNGDGTWDYTPSRYSMDFRTPERRAGYFSCLVSANKNHNDLTWPAIGYGKPSKFNRLYPYAEEVAKTVLDSKDVSAQGFVKGYNGDMYIVFVNRDNTTAVVGIVGGRPLKYYTGEYPLKTAFLIENQPVEPQEPLREFDYKNRPKNIGLWERIDDVISDPDSLPSDPQSALERIYEVFNIIEGYN